MFKSPSSPSFASLLAVLFSLLLLSGCASEPETATEQTPEENAEAMAKEHAGDAPEASPATVPEPAVPVVTERVVYGEVGGAEVTGFVARPESGGEGLPGLIVIQEWWGLNENIEAMARRLAGEGYVALAVDMYGGQVATTPDDARGLMTAAFENSDALDENLRAAYTWLEGQGAPRIGSVGWCFGGGLSLRTALLHPESLDAAVIYYGRVVTDPEELAPLKVPVLGLFGAEDGGIPVDGVRAFETALTDLGQEPIIRVYENADHAFANPSGTNYSAEVADQAWGETTSFFATHLKQEAAE
ncbi:MAG: dienelactone hydrolase family protein [Acidobacteriota bacterium]